MIEIVPAGQDATDPQPGDLIFCHRPGIVSALIRAGQRLRPGDSRWSHVAVVEGPVGDGTVGLIEALTRCVTRSPLSEYRHIEYAICRTRLHGDDQRQAIAFAISCLGQRYGWGVILGIALRYLTPGRGLWFGSNGTEICSGLAAQMLVRGWANFPVNPASMTPAELAASL